MTEANIDPVFLVGALRSGTTVAHLMLDSHPQISNPGEYDFFFDFISDEGEAPDSETLLCLLEKNRVYEFSGLKYDPALDHKANLQQFFRQLANGRENLIINIHRNYHRIIKLFPNAKFLHLVRDPRDVARSSIGMGWAGNVYYGVDHWIDSEYSWDRLVSQLKDDQHLEFKFEDLIVDTDRTLTDICQFIGVEFTQQMYDYQNESTYSAPDNNLVSQWKTKLSPDELRQVESKTVDLMNRRGYPQASDRQFKFGVLKKYRLFSQNKYAKWKYGINRIGLSKFLIEKITRKLHLEKQHAKVQKEINAIYQQGLK